MDNNLVGKIYAHIENLKEAHIVLAQEWTSSKLKAI